MAKVERCTDCLVGKRPENGHCGYCARMHSTITPKRQPMRATARRIALATLAFALAAAAFRVGVYAWRYSLMTALIGGDYSGRDAFHRTNALLGFSYLLILLSSTFSTRQTRRWMRLGSANALTRPEIGLRWLRTLPSARLLIRWRLASVASWLAMAVALIVFVDENSDPDRVQLSAEVQIALSAVYAVVAIGQAWFLRVATRELENSLDRLDAADTVPAPAAP